MAKLALCCLGIAAGARESFQKYNTKLIKLTGARASELAGRQAGRLTSDVLRGSRAWRLKVR